MKSDLKIGNYVFDGKEIIIINDNYTLFKTLVNIERGNGIKRIEITEERLLDLGFKKEENNWKTLDLGFATISWERLAGLALVFEKESIWLEHIKYINQVQNLYFELKNEELTFKPKQMEVQTIEEGWVKFKRYPCKEGHIDVWSGDQSCDPNKPERPHFNLNTQTTYLRCNGSLWINKADLKLKKHYTSILFVRTEFTAVEIWNKITHES